jgi:hypothetical protein
MLSSNLSNYNENRFSVSKSTKTVATEAQVESDRMFLPERKEKPNSRSNNKLVNIWLACRECKDDVLQPIKMAAKTAKTFSPFFDREK